MFTANIVPGQGFLPFTVYEKSSDVTTSGRAVDGDYERTTKQFYAIITNASQAEKDQWKQNGHPISHKITQYGGANPAKATDILKAGNGGQFYVQGAKKPAGLNLTAIYYVEERFDVIKELV